MGKLVCCLLNSHHIHFTLMLTLSTCRPQIIQQSSNHLEPPWVIFRNWGSMTTAFDLVKERKNFLKRNEGGKEIVEAGLLKEKKWLVKESFQKLSQNMSHWIASLSGSRALEGGTNNNERNGGGRGMKKYDGEHDLRKTETMPTLVQSKIVCSHFSAIQPDLDIKVGLSSRFCRSSVMHWLQYFLHCEEYRTSKTKLFSDFFLALSQLVNYEYPRTQRTLFMKLLRNVSMW